MRLHKQSIVAVVIVIVNCCFILLTASHSLRAPKWKEETDASSNSHMKSITKGTELRLSCAVKGYPRPYVFWYKNDTLLTNSDKIELRTHNLTLKDIQPSDQGNYKCIANNSVGKIEFTFIVDVKEAPEWKKDSDSHSNSTMKNVLEGTAFKLSCSAKGDPKPDVFWYKDFTHFMPNSDKINVTGHILKFSDIQTSDHGNYTCVANNSVGKIEFTFIVNVKEVLWPLLVNVSEKLTVHEGETAKFYCIVLNDKTAKIQWLRIKPTDESQSRDLTTRDESSDTLVILHVTKDDEGQYACMVHNQYDSKSHYIHLTVLEVTTTTPTTTTTTLTTTTTTPTTKSTTLTTTTAATSTATTIKTRPMGTEKHKSDKTKQKGKKAMKNKSKNEKPEKNKNKNVGEHDDEDLDPDDINEVDISTPYMVDKNDKLGKEYGVRNTYNTGEKSNFNVITNMYEPKNPNMDTFLDTILERGNEDNDLPYATPVGENMDKNKYSDSGDRNATANVLSASSGGISIWTVYIIVGAVAGGLLLAGLVAVAVVLFCQYNHKDESQYKSSSV